MVRSRPIRALTVVALVATLSLVPVAAQAVPRHDDGLGGPSVSWWEVARNWILSLWGAESPTWDPTGNRPTGSPPGSVAAGDPRGDLELSRPETEPTVAD